MTADIVETIGLAFDIVGALYVVKGMIAVRDDALAKASDSTATWAAEGGRPNPRPALLQLLKDSRRDARIGAGLLVVGFLGQIIATWID